MIKNDSIRYQTTPQKSEFDQKSTRNRRFCNAAPPFLSRLSPFSLITARQMHGKCRLNARYCTLGAYKNADFSNPKPQIRPLETPTSDNHSRNPLPVFSGNGASEKQPFPFPIYGD